MILLNIGKALKKEQIMYRYHKPTQEGFQTVIDNFKKALEPGKRPRINMADGLVHSCGSPMCHGGWYAAVNGYDETYTFQVGANLMATHLGFDSKWHLEWWAEHHPEIWGNKYGEEMFYACIAFTGIPNKKVRSLTTIIKFWEKVKIRAAKYGK